MLRIHPIGVDVNDSVLPGIEVELPQFFGKGKPERLFTAKANGDGWSFGTHGGELFPVGPNSDTDGVSGKEGGMPRGSGAMGAGHQLIVSGKHGYSI
jgi:hypothetical protein